MEINWETAGREAYVCRNIYTVDADLWKDIRFILEWHLRYYSVRRQA